MGLIVLFVLAVYILFSIGLAVGAHYLGKRKCWRWCRWWTIGLVMFLIPTWDIPIGRVYFNHLCNTEAGMFVYQDVQLPEEYFLKAGERNNRYPDRSEHAYAKGGELNLDRVKTAYDIKMDIDREYSVWGHISKMTTKITDKSSGEVLSESISFGSRGGWLFSMTPTPGIGRECPDTVRPVKGRLHTLHSVLPEKTFERN